MRWIRMVLLLGVLIQLPFLYSLFLSYRVDHYLRSFPAPVIQSVPFHDLRGSIHVHSAAGGHSLGTYAEVLEAARQAGYRYLFITEHPRGQPTLARIEDPSLIVIYGFEEEVAPDFRILRDEEGTVRILTEARDQPPPENISGMEVYNMHENAEAADSWFQRANFLYHQLGYAELFYFQIWRINWQRLNLWDRWNRRRPIAGFGGNDAHQNVGLVFQTTSGRPLFSLMLDPYLRSLRFLTNHVILPEGSAVTKESVLKALREGASYIAFESIADPTGFSFHALEKGVPRSMGTAISLQSRLVMQSPYPARFSIIRDGKRFRDLEGTRFEMNVDGPGVYRIEVYPLDPPGLLEGKPWIISNPIYVNET